MSQTIVTPMLKRLFQLSFFIFAFGVGGFFLFGFHAGDAQASDKYWVGGTGSWDGSTTTHWSTTDGGSGGAGVPSSSDNVFFTSSSSTSNAAYTVTITATANVLDFNMAGPGGGNKVTWAGSSALNIFGSLNLSGGTAGITRSYTGTITFSATSTGKTIDANGVTLASPVTISGASGGWTLSNDFNIGSSSLTYSASGGTFDTNGKTVTLSSWLSSNTKTLTLGTSTINCSNAFNVSAGDTVSASSSTITTGANFAGGGKTYGTVTVTANAATRTITGANTFATLTYIGSSSAGPEMALDSNQTITGTLTINGNDAATKRLFVRSDTKGTQRTLTAAVVVITNADFQDIVGAGAASWDLSAISGGSGNCGNNSMQALGDAAFTPAANMYWKHGGTASVGYSTLANWYLATNGGGGAGRVPLPQDTAIFDGNSFSASGKTVTQDMLRVGAIDFTGATNTPTFTTSTVASIYGSMTLIAGMTLTASTQAYTTENRSGTITLTSGGQTWAKSWTILSIGGTVSLGDALTINTISTLTVTNGTFNDNNQNVTTGLFSSNNSNTRSITMGSAQWTITGNNGTVWTTSTTTGLTFTRGSNPIAFNYSGSTGTRTITLGSLAEANAPDINITAGSDIIVLTGNLRHMNFTGFTGSLTSGARSVYGNWTTASGMTMTDGSSATTFAATSGTQTLTSNTVTFGSPIIQNNPGATLTLADHLTIPTGRTLTFTAGTFNDNNKNVSLGLFSSSNSNTRSLALGSGQWTITGNNGTVWTTSTTTGLTFTRGSNPIAFNYSGSTGTRTITLGSLAEANVPDINITAGTDIIALTGSVRTPNFTGFAGSVSSQTRTVYGDWTTVVGMTMTDGSNTTTFAATSGTQTLTSNSITFGSPITQNNPGATLTFADHLTIPSTRTFTLTAGTLNDNNKNVSVGVFSSSNSSTRSLALGTGQWTITGNAGTIWTTGTTTGLTFTRGSNPIAFNYSGSTGTRTITLGSLAEANVPDVSITAGTDTVSLGGSARHVSFTGFSGTLSNNTRSLYGNITFGTGMTVTDGNSVTTFAATSGTQVITANSVIVSASLTQDGVGGTVQLADNLTLVIGRAYTLTNGTFDLNSKVFKPSSFSSNNSNTRTVTSTGGGGTIDLITTNISTCWDFTTSTNATLSLSGVTIKISGSTTNTRTFAGGGMTYGTLWFTNATANGQLTISGSNTFSDIKYNDSTAQTIKFTAGTTTHVTTFTVSGTPSNLVTINSTNTSTFAIVKDGGGTISSDYLNIQHSVATPGTTWFGGIHSTDNQSVSAAGSGWLFTGVDSPSVPTLPYANTAANGAQLGATNPNSLDSVNIVFSAIYNDPNVGDVANKYRLQIASDNAFTSVLYDSGSSGTSITDIPLGSRSIDITTNATLSLGTIYYWRIKFWDTAGNEGTFTASGSGASSILANTPPTVPTILYLNTYATGAQSGSVNPTTLASKDIVVSAVNNDPNGDAANKYQVQVASDNGFTSIIYDSGSSGTSMTSTANGARSPNLSVPGVFEENVTYYWRIKFWDVLGTEGAFSASGIDAATFKTAIGLSPAITTLDSTGLVGLRMSLAMGLDDFPRIAYNDDTNGTVKFVQCTNAECTTSIITVLDVTGSVGITGTTRSDQNISVAIGADGFARISYLCALSCDSGGSDDLMFLRCTNAACTTNVTTTVDSTGAVGFYSSLVLDSSGFGRISYFDSTNTALKYAQCTDNDCSTSSIVTIDNNGDTGEYTSIKMSPDGFVRIAYQCHITCVSGTNFNDLMFVQCTNDSCSTNVITTIDSTGNQGYANSLAIGTDGFARVSWYDNTNHDLKYVQCKSETCDPADADPAQRPVVTAVDSVGDIGFFNSIAIGADGFARMSTFDIPNLNLKFIRCTNDPCSTSVITVVDGAGGKGAFNSLALGADGFARITYFDESNEDLKFMRCTNADCTIITPVTNTAPTAPTTLYVNTTTSTAQSGLVNPLTLNTTSVVFSAIYNDDDSGDIANKYRLQISTDNTFGTTDYDSGGLGTNLTDIIAGNRSIDITPTGFTPAFGTLYYWRIKFWDDDAAEGTFSSSASFMVVDSTTPSSSHSTGFGSVGFVPIPPSSEAYIPPSFDSSDHHLPIPPTNELPNIPPPPSTEPSGSIDIQHPVVPLVTIQTEAQIIKTAVPVIIAGAVESVRDLLAEQLIETRLFVPLAKNQFSAADAKIEMISFITYGTPSTLRLGGGERAGVLGSYVAAFGVLPTSEKNWEDVLKIANGRFPSQTNTVAEQRASKNFVAIYLRKPLVKSNEHDKAAVTVMAYGLRPVQRSLSSEAAAMKTFKEIYNRIAQSSREWDIVRAIAYSGAKR